MHEAAVAKEIFDIVEKAAREGGLSYVTRVVLEIGEFSCINADQLVTAWSILTRGTNYAAARLEPLRVGARARCGHCKREFGVTFTDKACPDCGRLSDEITAGYGMKITEIEGE